MEVINKIKIDLLRAGVKPIINAMQADENSRVIEITLNANGDAWEIPDGVSFSVAYKKPDGTQGLYDTMPDGTSASSVDGNVVSIRLAPQMLTAHGTVNTSVVISSGDQRISTFPIIVNVIQNPAVGAVESEDYFYSSAIGNLDDLKTTNKTSLVAAINEVFGTGGNGGTDEVYIVPEGGTVEDAPPGAAIIIDPNGEANLPAGDTSLNVTGAAVGQTVKIAAVDENGAPTAWEPVDLPSGGSADWELVADVTLEEDTKAIEYTDLNAQDLRFSFEGRFNNAADDMANANAEVYFHLSNNAWDVPIGKGMFGYVRPTGNTCIGVGEAKVMAGFGYVRSMVLGGGLNATGQADSGRQHGLNAIPRFKMETVGDYLFKAGGKFKLYKKA